MGDGQPKQAAPTGLGHPAGFFRQQSAPLELNLCWSGFYFKGKGLPCFKFMLQAT